MKYKVEFSKESMSDLNEIFNYIYLNSVDENTANKFVNSIINYCEILINNPEIGKELFLLNIKTKFRYLVYKKYYIFYSTKDKIITIYRIISSRRDYIKVLFEQ